MVVIDELRSVKEHTSHVLKVLVNKENIQAALMDAVKANLYSLQIC